MYFIQFYKYTFLFICYNAFETPDDGGNSVGPEQAEEEEISAEETLERLRNFSRGFDTALGEEEERAVRLAALSTENLSGRDRDLADIALDALRPGESGDIGGDLNREELELSISALESEIGVVGEQIANGGGEVDVRILEARQALYERMIAGINSVISEEVPGETAGEEVGTPEQRARALLSQYRSFDEIRGLSGEDIRAVQEALNNLGYDAGVADGQPGRRTQSGFNDYRRSVREEQMNINWSTDYMENARQFSRIQSIDGQMGLHEEEGITSDLFGYGANTSETPWCAGYVNKNLQEAGFSYRISYNLRAKAFIECVDPVREPAHVFFMTPDKRALGGNQNNRVCVQTINAPIIGWVMPEDIGNPNKTYTRDKDGDEAVDPANIPAGAVVVTQRGGNT